MQSPENLDEEEAREALERIRQGVRRADPELVAYGEDDLEELNRFLVPSQAVTSAFARKHRQRETAIVG